MDEPAFGDLHGAMLGNLDKAAALFEMIDKKGIKEWLLILENGCFLLCFNMTNRY